MPERVIAVSTANNLYRLLCQRADVSARVERVLLGLNWTVAQVQPEHASRQGVGLCFSPMDVPRVLEWPGTLSERPTTELVQWLNSWEPCQAAVGASVVNALINASSGALSQSVPLDNGFPAHLQVFGHFAPQLAGASVAVIGRYPGLENCFGPEVKLTCIERRPQPGDLPDPAAEFILPAADWVFITASSIANKTLPRLLELSRDARVVLMGPSLPWLMDWADFGVNYLAGVATTDPDALFTIAAEGGGTRIFGRGVQYRLLAL